MTAIGYNFVYSYADAAGNPTRYRGDESRKALQGAARVARGILDGSAVTGSARFYDDRALSLAASLFTTAPQLDNSGIDLAIGAIDSALNGLNALEQLTRQADGVARAAQGATIVSQEVV